MNKSNEIKKIFKNYLIYFEPTIKSKEFIIIKEIISIPELIKDKKSLKLNYIPKKYAIFVNGDNYLIFDLNKIKLKNTKNSNINDNIILIKKHLINILNNNSVNNSYLNKIHYFHYFSIHNNNKLNQINNFNIKYQNQNMNYIKIINNKLFLRILENKAIITINATKTGSNTYSFLYANIQLGEHDKVKRNGTEVGVNDRKYNKISLQSGIYIIEVIFKQLTSLESMFAQCSSIISLDLSNLDTSNITNANSMFSGCSSLKSLNLSNFDTSNIENAQYMFSRCSSLKSLDLSNFNTAKISDASNMFSGCNNLKYINLYNFKGNKNIFPNTLNNGNLIICINNESNAAVGYLPNAIRNCLITNLQLRINYCLNINNIEYGLYINGNIVELNKTDECTYYYYINMNEDNLIFQNILYKNNIILRSKNLNITNIIETERYEGCTLDKENNTAYPKGILYCDFDA